ncbi:MAG TPA: TRAFs-binding domain-containing protein [Pyrinomonadaceae bacterium]|nr:TRAFs-binding domain-containing protein [Pyrinomonadaceae bacterium]
MPRGPFKPSVVDTSSVKLTDDVQALVEQLAENTHNVWARQRLLDGWTYGPKRDDLRKKHPCLVAYEQLPESEKEYDRHTAVETLKVALKLGYQLVRSEASPKPGTSGPINTPSQSENQIDSLKLASLLALWHQRSSEDWSATPQIYRRLGQRVLKLGEPLLAYDVLTEGLKCSPGDVRLQQLLALALARSGATLRANALLMRLLEQGHSDEETLGILARTHKDLWARAVAPTERKRQLRLAHQFYAESYKLNRGYYAGINAATLSLQLGNQDEASSLARNVMKASLKELEALPMDNPNRYWPLATAGEAALILGRWSEAEDYYSQAAEIGRGHFVELSSTRRNARLILDHLGRDRSAIEQCLRIPRVAVFTGHMIDRPNRATPRFPPQLEHAVREQIRSELKRLDVGIGFASAASGSDILFLETIVELGGEAHIVLPYGPDQFVQDSVEISAGDGWRDRFQRLLGQTVEVVTASEEKLTEDQTSYEYANLLLTGLAGIKAQQLETELIPLAVWDGKRGDGPGGTASMVQHWRSMGLDVGVIDLAQVLEMNRRQLTGIPTAVSSVKRQSRTRPAKLATRMMAMLFADALNFSKLTEAQIPKFVDHFLGAIAKLISTSSYGPLVKNTWGDGLYFVFSSVREAGQFSLDLCDLIVSTDWTQKGLPKDLNLRIALHAGPVYSCVDPVLEQATFTGTHVSRAARIEPVTPPGQVYASQPFAALAAAQNVSEFSCDYVGQTPLAKGYGTFPTYHVRRLNSPAPKKKRR